MTPAVPAGWPVAWQTWPRYLPWQARPRPNGGTGKVPVGAVGGLLCPVDPLESRHWMTWEAAWAAVHRGDATGVGVALDRSLGVTAIDLDGCVEGEALSRDAATILAAFPSAYAERSPSGTGLHVLVPAPCPAGWRRQRGVEVIDQGFLTVTGQTWRAGVQGSEDAAALRRWHAARQPAAGTAGPPCPSAGPSVSDEALLRRARAARNGARFDVLWAGGRAGLPSDSEADLALLLLLLYWGGSGLSDARLGSLFRQSGRCRSKWGTAEAPSPYARRTLAAARRIAARRR